MRKVEKYAWLGLLVVGGCGLLYFMGAVIMDTASRDIKRVQDQRYLVIATVGEKPFKFWFNVDQVVFHRNKVKFNTGWSYRRAISDSSVRIIHTSSWITLPDYITVQYDNEALEEVLKRNGDLIGETDLNQILKDRRSAHAN